LQASVVHAWLSSQLSAGPPTHAPFVQVSAVVQVLPSSHGFVLVVKTQPVAGLHASVVQTLLSLQSCGAPPTQIPAASQVSPIVQALPSSHDAPGVSVLTHPLTGSHVSVAQLPTTFHLTDEIYQFKNYSRDKVHVLMSLDVASVDLTKKGVNRTDKDFATAWTRSYGKGRVFYTALGHREEVWKDERFQKHLVGGLRWAARF